MADEMIFETQRWLNGTYEDKTGFGSVPMDGKTGWATINALIRALQIELGITATANNFGPGTQSRFTSRWPHGITKNNAASNVHGIIQGALWCKGYPAEYGGITTKFTDNVASSIRKMKGDIGLSDTSSTVDVELMMALLSMKQFRLLSAYGGKGPIRTIQQTINRSYKAYTGILPTDGIYGREMNTGLIQVLQKLEGFSASQATGNFGNGTRSRLQTISGGSGEWVWLASAALVCNGHASSVTNTWTADLASQVRAFQAAYALPVTGVVDPTTWMSLLTSKGDPNRACVACDTRFEITDELAKHLKADGYKIVGRYLSEPGQSGKAEKEYFKALRTGELERIVDQGLQYFPIFQEYSTKLSHFSVENGDRHAKEAQAAAKRLGIPPTVIYFAVDYDATDPEVTSSILPYFQAVNANLGGGYRVGIYASRNICTRVAEAGYSVASFVSDMSTGFSGNLGFPIPNNWAFDQFHEISGYHGKWDLDRVAYSGRIGAVGSVRHTTGHGEVAVPYSAPPVPTFNGLPTWNSIHPSITRLENAIDDYMKSKAGAGPLPQTYSTETLRLTLEYLAIDYLKESNFAIAAGTRAPNELRDYLHQHHKSLVTDLDRHIGSNRIEFTDPYRRGKNDLAHMAYTLLCYLTTSPAPDFWTGWGGDLATGMADLHVLMQRHPSLDRQRAANALIGSDPQAVDNYLTSHGVEPQKLQVRCNFTDICDDADAILLSKMLKDNPPKDLHALSDTINSYYSEIIVQNRYTAYEADGLDYTSQDSLASSIWGKINSFGTDFPGVGLHRLAGDSTGEERVACCRALAGYLLARSH
ncbi:DUF1906 domain-containing protein [Gleimia hominis]|uniref:DUF1906 domain-containing protein n=1 Tax=Gleimia hominis TaxID=595468 RepID=A0ABU3ICT2_9ACTO|nr:glycoside hydrolase domain-containing protein [Gleimia hominis]MDT3768181.1 DUF1906 domain-containing protein [Gleimia hominis]